MAPSITETLYALGLGDRVVGVTRYCQYPPEVKGKPQIGGYYDPNFEAIVALKPDLVVMLDEHELIAAGLRKAESEDAGGMSQDHRGIIESFRTIGRVCGKEAEGRRMAEQYETRLRRIRAKTRGLPRPRVLMALDRTFGQGHLSRRLHRRRRRLLRSDDRIGRRAECLPRRRWSATRSSRPKASMAESRRDYRRGVEGSRPAVWPRDDRRRLERAGTGRRP